VIRGARHNTADRVEGFSTGARHEQRRPAIHDFPADGRNLGGRLSEAQNHLREALPYCAVVIDFRKAEVFERARLEGFDEMLERVGGCDVTARDAIE
jgi:hypothetical protein